MGKRAVITETVHAGQGFVITYTDKFKEFALTVDGVVLVTAHAVAEWFTVVDKSGARPVWLGTVAGRDAALAKLIEIASAA